MSVDNNTKLCYYSYRTPNCVLKAVKNLEFGFFLIGALLVGAFVFLVDDIKRTKKRQKCYDERLERIASSLESIEIILNK